MLYSEPHSRGNLEGGFVLLSYRHGFHAGNPADVLKHSVLSLVLESLQKKEKPFFVLETHAGAGRYDLRSEFAQKNREYEAGIDRVLAQKDLPSELDAYLETVRELNPSGSLKFYPGSPCLIQKGTRITDRIVLAELHSEEVAILRRTIRNDARVRIDQQDGYGLLKSLLPPPERRGLVHIDPAYERSDECDRLIKAVAEGIRRWESGIYVIWYPILKRWSSRRLVQALSELTSRPKLIAELVTDSSSETGMQGSGVLVINPPWQLDQRLGVVLPWFSKVFSGENGGYSNVEWLDG